MKLIRFAIVKLEKAGPHFPPTKFEIQGVEVRVDQECFRDNESKIRKMPLTAITNLPELPKIIDGGIEIPETARRKSELAIEAIANYISIGESCRRSIWSPYPSIALMPEKDEERHWLDATEGILYENHARILVELGVSISPDLLNQLLDRLDGVALLSEVLASQHATGRFHEMVRLFERAFGFSVKQAEKKIYQFLASARQGFTREEVKSWVSLRDPATHADVRDDFVMESTISRVIHRMEQASYDVLFNKLKWRDRSTERRTVFSPLVATMDSAHQEVIGVTGASTQYSIVSWDGFNVFRQDFDVKLNWLQPEWWIKAKHLQENI